MSGHKIIQGLTEAVATARIARLEAENARLREEIERLNALINTPQTDDWMAGARTEAAHQQERWSTDNGAGKSAFDWFWLIGYLAQKAADAQVRGDTEKAKHHTISTAAALLNWHRALTGEATGMRPGIEPPDQ